MDRLVIGFVVLMLPITVLPQSFFPLIINIFALACIVALWFRTSLVILFALLLINYSYIDSVAKKSITEADFADTQTIQIVQILKQQDYQTAIGETHTGKRLYLHWQSEIPLILSAYYQIKLVPRPISARLNKGNFDRQRWYVAQHIDAIATVKKAQLIENKALSFRASWLYRIKKQLTDLSSEGILLALTLGERAWLKASDWAIFQHTTTAHLIAISGLHIGLAMGFGFWLAKVMQWLILKYGRNFNFIGLGFSFLFPRIIGLIFALSYSSLAGFSIPTLRALLAIVFVFLCQLKRRCYTPWQYWWRVIALLLLCDPLTLLSDSFWLSILAVGSLIIWYRYFPLKQFPWCENCKKFHLFNRLLLSLAHLQLGIWLVFSPVQLFFFEGTSPFAFLANMLIVPMYSFLLVPLIFISLMTDNILQTWQLADWLVQISMYLIEPLSHYWFNLSTESQWQLLSINLLFLVILWAIIQRTSKFIMSILFILLILFNRSYAFFEWLFPFPLVQWVHFDVGQGLAMGLIYKEKGEKKAILYDTGAKWAGGSMAQLEIIPYLIRQGIDVEALFVSHDDNDHSGGVKPLLKRYPKAKLVVSGQNNYGHHKVEHCQLGTYWQFGDYINIKAVYPHSIIANKKARARNEDSCVLQVEIKVGEYDKKIKEYRLLLTGDSGVEQERIFSPLVGKINFLQVGHHGSKTSTSHTLLATTQPEWAIISSGRWNPWKLPHQSILANLQQHKISVLNTAETGMITVSFYESHYEIQSTRTVFSPWYQQLFH
ncbi:competence protein ComEC [Nicoletella semolina]|uniref:Competence protein ComEC n=1 Tax=Nicoletella semolina TaxID=271160 RepID=A0A4V2SJW5_9PAST|nr:DNA internalization-related competence protein ComEC/Rec2 [Nicoletella semolina]MDH2923864.1 recombinase [Nicoletella semolina]TCP17176.1 competence protein ComEC [Nicoletella semolina]